ncbi:hypothetical protein AFLA_004067 [Aspergillus flavus NRRL3357]|nr:hypothetical protein AFLA_004067 [Aspergillus flavus NRRL3357]
MDQARYDISPHITVLGCILYSRVPKSQETHVSHIVRSEPRRKIVIFSHHSPTLAAAAVDPVHANSPISSGFATDIA